MDFEQIRITGVVADEVGVPRSGGTRGSALYAVPLQLNRRPPASWATLFVQVWDRPPRFTTMHRPGIARVVGDRIVLNGTTVEEVEKVHRDTLKLVLEVVNERFAAELDQHDKQTQQRAAAEVEHRKHVEEVAGRIAFD